jgi:hypothetical protein
VFRQPKQGAPRAFVEGATILALPESSRVNKTRRHLTPQHTL